MTGETLRSDQATEPRWLPGTQAVIETLRIKPTLSIGCLFRDGPAVVIRQMEEGCQALPDVVVQPLCQQHDISRSPIGDDDLVVDLSIDGKWSASRGNTPVYYISQGLQLVETAPAPEVLPL